MIGLLLADSFCPPPSHELPALLRVPSFPFAFFTTRWPRSKPPLCTSPPWRNQTTAQGGYGCPSGTGPHRPKVRSTQRSLGDGPRQRLLCHSLSPMSSPGCHVPGKGGGWEREGRRTSAFLLSYDQLLGTWPGAWNETRKPLIYIIC